MERRRLTPRIARAGTLAQWRVAEAPAGLPVSVHPAARFACAGAGSCCQGGLLVRLTPREAQAARRAAARLFPGRSVDPIRLVAAGDSVQWALANAEGCPFLEARRCLVHDTPAHPAPCRVFPVRFVVAEGRVYASASHRCGCGALGLGPALEAQRAELTRRLAAERLVHRVPARTRVAAHDERPTRRVLPRMVAALGGAEAVAPDPFALLDRVAAALAPPAEPTGAVSRSVPAPERLLDRLRAALGPARATSNLGRAVSGEEHPRLEALRLDLRAAGLHAPAADARAEVGRFVRDHVFGLQLYRFETLSAGVLALGLAAARCLRGLPPDGHPVARARIMLWESALADPGLAWVLALGGPLGALAGDLDRARRMLPRLDAWSRSCEA